MLRYATRNFKTATAYILLMLTALPVIGQETTVEEKERKTIRFTKIFFDETGKNRLEVMLKNPCVLSTPPWDAERCLIEIALIRGKKNTGISYNLPNPQMSLIYFNSSEVAIKRVNGSNAVFVPSYYCGNSEDYDKRVTYAVFYKSKVYFHHLDFRCDDNGRCSPKKELLKVLADIPPALKPYYIQYITAKHLSAKSFYQ